MTTLQNSITDAEGTQAWLESSDTERATIRLENGRLIDVARSSLTELDGGYTVDFNLRRLMEEGELAVPVIEEHLDVDKREVERTVRILKSVRSRDVVVDEELRREDIEIERVAVNRYVDEPQSVREVDGKMIIPLTEEVLVVEKKLLLREELHVTRHETTVPFNEVHTLRSEEVSIERDEDSHGS